MSQIAQVTVATITKIHNYVVARKEADELAAKHGLVVADMPLVIQTMSRHAEVREAIRPTFIDVVSGEYHGQRDGGRSYEVWHSVGSLATVAGLAGAFSRRSDYGFMPVAGDEWAAVGNGRYHGRDVVRVHLDDVRRGNVPLAGTPYTVFVRLDGDKPVINAAGQLDHATFMLDDRVLMVAGSPDAKEELAKMLFDRKEDGGEDWSSVGSYHRINDISFGAEAQGRPVRLGYGYSGLGGYETSTAMGASSWYRRRRRRAAASGE